jgi:hypothetical protein
VQIAVAASLGEENGWFGNLSVNRRERNGYESVFWTQQAPAWKGHERYQKQIISIIGLNGRHIATGFIRGAALQGTIWY